MPKDGSKLKIIIPVHVDDGLVATNSPELWEWLKVELNKDFAMNDGAANLFLGIKIDYDRERGLLSLSQKAYVDLLACGDVVTSRGGGTVGSRAVK